MDLICPRCRSLTPSDNTLSVWLLRRALDHLACTNPDCPGRYPLHPYPILLRDPGVVAEYLAPLPDIRPDHHVEGCFFLHDLPEPLFAALSKRSTYVWSHFHDLLPDVYRPPAPLDDVPFAKRAIALLDAAKLEDNTRALVVGCGPGREAFELALRLADLQHGPERPSVIAADIDPTLLSCLQALLQDGQLRFFLRASVDGWYGPETVTLPEVSARAFIEPVCIDALDPPFLPGEFDLIVALGLLDNVPDPLALLNQLNLLLGPGGYLLLATPFAWHPDVTPSGRRLSSVAPGELSEQVILERILTGELPLGYGPEMSFQAIAVEQIPWHLRIHDRHLHSYLPVVGLWQKR